MSRARRRDEWDRWSRLLALVDVRTQFGEDAQPVRPLDLWPPELVPKDMPAASPAAGVTNSNNLEITMDELAQLMLGAAPRRM